MTTDIQNLKSFDPFAEADDTGGETKTSQQNYIHIRIQRESIFLLSSTFFLLYRATPAPIPLAHYSPQG